MNEEVEELRPLVTSRLWVTGELVRNSVHFPAIVETAAWSAGVTYSDDLLRFVAADPALVDAIPADIVDGIDAILSYFAVDNGDLLDSLVVDAVSRYTPPPESTPPTDDGPPATY